MFVEFGIFDKRVVPSDRRRFAFRKVVFMTSATAATGCTVTRRRTVFMLGMRRGGKGGATFAFASMVTTVVGARAFFFVRILRIVGFMTIATADARRAGAGRRAVLVLRMRRGGKGGATFALASMVTTVLGARAFFFVRILRIVGFVAVATVFAVGLVASRRAVFVLRMFIGGKVGAFSHSQVW